MISVKEINSIVARNMVYLDKKKLVAEAKNMKPKAKLNVMEIRKTQLLPLVKETEIKSSIGRLAQQFMKESIVKSINSDLYDIKCKLLFKISSETLLVELVKN